MSCALHMPNKLQRFPDIGSSNKNNFAFDTQENHIMLQSIDNYAANCHFHFPRHLRRVLINLPWECFLIPFEEAPISCFYAL